MEVVVDEPVDCSGDVPESEDNDTVVAAADISGGDNEVAVLNAGNGDTEDAIAWFAVGNDSAALVEWRSPPWIAGTGA